MSWSDVCSRPSLDDPYVSAVPVKSGVTSLPDLGGHQGDESSEFTSDVPELPTCRKVLRREMYPT
jgi:hypothetical protein